MYKLKKTTYHYQ